MTDDAITGPGAADGADAAGGAAPGPAPEVDAGPEVEAGPEVDAGPEMTTGPDAAGEPGSAGDVAGSAGDDPGHAPVTPWWPARRPSMAGALIGVLLALLGFGLVVQLRSNSADVQPAARTEDLVRILSDLDARKDRLSREIAQLQGTSQKLQAGKEGRAEALQEARRRADELGILAGTLAAEGTGMRVRLVPGATPLRSWMVLDLVEELRGAGAEAMQIDGADGASVRIVASTYFTEAREGLVVDGQTLSPPYSITVIGDPQTMQPALNIPGGVVDTVHNAGGTVSVDQIGTVRVTALHHAGTLRYAQPVN